MPKKDLNQTAFAILQQATGEVAVPIETARQKAGRLGGVKGGAERAKKLTAEKRSEIAKKAAATRWER